MDLASCAAFEAAFSATHTKPSEDPYENGRNDCYMEILDKTIFIHKYINQVPEHLRNDFAALLIDEDIWMKVDLKKKKIEMLLNCNDTFAYACGDAEDISIDEIPAFLEQTKDTKYGYVAWIAKKRNEKPVVEYQEWMAKAGEWTSQLEALPENYCNKTVPRW